MSWLIVPWRYQRRFFKWCEWIDLELCIAWHNLLKEKAIFGLVNVKYCNDPTIRRHNQGEKTVEVSFDNKGYFITTGVETCLQFIIPECWRISTIFLDWCRNKPKVGCSIVMPRNYCTFPRFIISKNFYKIEIKCLMDSFLFIVNIIVFTNSIRYKLIEPFCRKTRKDL